MLNGIIRLALRYRLLIVFLSLASLVYGGFTAANLPIDVFPALDRPRVVILTECPGYAPGDVETLVTFPLESSINGATGVTAVRSQSGPSLSVVYIDFEWGTNIYTARQIVQERVSTVQIPQGITPQMAPISSIMGQIMIVGLSYKDGPGGGRLTPVGETDYLAEIIASPENGRLELTLWNPRDAKGLLIKDVSQWEEVKSSDASLSLTWTESVEGKTIREFAVTLEHQAGSPGTFAGKAKELQHIDQQAIARSQQRTVIAVDGNGHPVHMKSTVAREMKLRTLADWDIRLRLRKLTGVAQVVTMGGEHKQYQVLVNPRALHRFEITLDDVAKALEKNNISTSGGFADRGGKEKPIRFLGRLGPESHKVLEDLEKIPVKRTRQRNVILKEVARIIEGPELKRGDASINGKPGVALTITKQPKVDTRDLSNRIIRALDDLEGSLPPHVQVNPNLFQMKKFIDLGIFNVGEALVVGALLVLIVLFLFLLNFRTTFISLTAIPLSLMITAIVFRMVGWLTGTELSINVMTLGGIAVAMGELVDDAIVDVENIFRRLRENNTLEKPLPPLRVIYEASVEIRSAIVFGTAMVILVFLPLFALSGIEGRLFAPLGIAYIVSILASLFISLTVTPVLSYYLLARSKTTEVEKDSFLLRGLKWGASHFIRFSMAHAGKLLFLGWLAVGACVWLLTQLGTDFLPDFDEGSVQVNVILAPGSSLEASNRATALVDAHFLKLRASSEKPTNPILHFVRRTGRAELDEHAEPVSNTEYILTMNPESGRSREETIKELLEDLKELQTGGDIEVEQPLAHLISHMLTGVTAQIAIKIYGDDLELLRRTAEEVKQAITDVDGIAPPVVEGQQLVEEIHIAPRQDALTLYGIHRDQLARYVRTSLYGDTVSQVVQGEQRYDLLLRMDEPYRSDYENLNRLLIRGGDKDKPLSLGMLATVRDELGPNVINRENVRRRIIIRVNTLGRDLGSVVADIQQKIDTKVRMPQGYFVELGGQFESQQRATMLIAVLATVSFVGMFVVLSMLYPSTRIVLQILNALPTAFVGGVLALWLTGQTLTVAGMVGFISLGGIAARNGILLVSHYFHLMKEEGEDFSTAMILRGSLERLSPVLMTALTAGFALLPLVIAGQEPGREILYPVATVILGGLITSTLCEFLIHPGLFWRFSGKDAVRLSQTVDSEWEEPAAT